MRRTALLGSIITAGCLWAAPAHATQLSVHGTSDVSDSGLESQVIEPGFAALDPADSVSYVPQGSGAAINAAEAAGSTVDVILVHSPPLEKGFVDGGFSAEPLGRALFYNDYVIVGPKSDPAHVLADFPHDAVGAFQAIAAEGAAGDATFVSRNDNSGTNTAEQAIWGQTTGLTLFQVAAGPPVRDVPSTSTSSNSAPAWYAKTGLQSQGQNLDRTNDCDTSQALYAQGGCYTIVDRGTYFFEQAAGHTDNLQIVSQDNAPTAVGGASELTNPFHAYIVSTSRNKALATRFLDYLTSPAFQARLVSYPGNGQTSVFPDAAPQVATSSIPTSAAAGSTVPITATLQYAPPVPQPIAGLPVQLQQSPSGAPGTFTDVGSPVSTDAAGSVSFAPTVGSATSFYRLSTAAYLDATSASLFSASTSSQLGAQNGRVDVDAPAATPAPTTSVAATAASPARVAPSNLVGFSRVRGSAAGTVSFALRVPGRGTTTISASTRSHGRKVTYAKQTTVRTTGAKRVSVTVRPGRAGSSALKRATSLHVVVTVTFTPAGGTKRTTTVSLTFSGSGRNRRASSLSVDG